MARSDDEQTPPPPPARQPRRGRTLLGRARARTSPPAAPPSPPSPATAGSSFSLPATVQEATLQQTYLQHGQLMNLMESMAEMPQYVQEIYDLHVQIENTRVALQTIQLDARNCPDIVRRPYEINQMIDSQLQLTNELGHGLTNAVEPSGSSYQAMNMVGTAAGNRRPTGVCRFCYSRCASMLLLPCQHVCACQYCGVNLTVCPLCSTPIAEAIEGRFCLRTEERFGVRYVRRRR